MQRQNVSRPGNNAWAKGATCTLRAGRRGLRLDVSGGLLWLTEDGRPEDQFLREGERLDLAPGARAVVQAMTDTSVRIDDVMAL